MLSTPISFQIWWSPAPGKTCIGNYRHFLLEQWSKHYQITTKREKKKKKVLNQLSFKNKILYQAVKSCNWLGFERGGMYLWVLEVASSILLFCKKMLYPECCLPWTPHWFPVPARPFLPFNPKLHHLPHHTDAAQIYCKRKRTHRGSNEALEIHTKGS